MTARPLAAVPAPEFRNPPILLAGPVDYDMYRTFRQQLDAAPQAGLISIELSTLGGDPEVARMMGEDVRFHSEVEPERRFVFLGMACVYSAGVTFMSFFARSNRYLTRGTRLMIHERKLDQDLPLHGPLSTCLAPLRAKLNEVEQSIRIQNEGFEHLILGSKVTLDEVLRRAPDNWYLEAREALALGLVEAVI
jgi:ATP-dependent protease ClpP protease subunit